MYTAQMVRTTQILRLIMILQELELISLPQDLDQNARSAIGLPFTGKDSSRMVELLLIQDRNQEVSQRPSLLVLVKCSIAGTSQSHSSTREPRPVSPAHPTTCGVPPSPGPQSVAR